MSQKFIPYRSSKKQRIAALNADLDTEISALQTVYANLAGDSADPAIAASTAKAVLLAAIAALVQPPAAGPTIVADIPTTLDPGQRVWCTATNSEWIGADPANGIFPTL